MTVFVVTRDTYYDEQDLVSVHAGEIGALAQCCVLNEQQLRLGHPPAYARKAQFAYHPGSYSWKEIEVIP